MLRIAAFIFFTLTSSLLYSYMQLGDIILYQGEEWEIYSNPLEEFFQIHPNKRPLLGYPNYLRGYRAIFDIQEDQLRLLDIEIVDYEETRYAMPGIIVYESVLSEVFPKESHIPVSWYSGLLIIPKGDILRYYEYGYASSFERYTILRIEEGRLVGQVDLSHDEYIHFRELQREAFWESPKFQELWAVAIRMSQEEWDEEDSDYWRYYLTVQDTWYLSHLLKDHLFP